jgi:hypothetical protein
MSYDADVPRARRLFPLVKEGFAASLTEAGTRFAISHPAMGYASMSVHVEADGLRPLIVVGACGALVNAIAATVTT